MSHVHILAPRAFSRAVLWVDCPDCKKCSPFATLYYEWYGPSSTCMRCGRNYQEGEWIPLDFRRGVREESKRSMRAAWKRAKPAPARREGEES